MYIILLLSYCKILKIKPGAYIFRRAFLGGLFLEGLIFGARGLSMEGNCVSKLIGQLYGWKEIYPFCFVLLCI